MATLPAATPLALSSLLPSYPLGGQKMGGGLYAGRLLPVLALQGTRGCRLSCVVELLALPELLLLCKALDDAGLGLLDLSILSSITQWRQQQLCS